MFKWIVPVVLVVIVAIIGGIGSVMYFNTTNTEIDIRNQIKAQQKSNEVIYDEVWKVLQQKAGVLDKYSSDFKEAFGGIMNARYSGESNGAPMFKWIQEHNPSFSVEMYKDLSVSIESQRAKFTRVQNKLLDLKREHDNLRLKFPYRLFVGNVPEIEIKIVTSSKTEKTFETGKEDNINLFSKE